MTVAGATATIVVTTVAAKTAGWIDIMEILIETSISRSNVQMDSCGCDDDCSDCDRCSDERKDNSCWDNG